MKVSHDTTVLFVFITQRGAILGADVLAIKQSYLQNTSCGTDYTRCLEGVSCNQRYLMQ